MREPPTNGRTKCEFRDEKAFELGNKAVRLGGKAAIRAAKAAGDRVERQELPGKGSGPNPPEVTDVGQLKPRARPLTRKEFVQ